MERHPSRLFVPYKGVGDVCSSVPPAFRVLTRKRNESFVVCAIDNVVVQYSCEHLRLISVSNVLPARINIIAADSLYIYAAVGKRIAVLHFARQVKRWLEISETVQLLHPFGNILIAVDVKSCIHILDIENFVDLIVIETSGHFDCSAITHPATYLNKILLGSKQGTLRIINVKTGKLIHEFGKSFGSEITVLEQSPAIDVIGVGLKNGEIILHNIRFDETIYKYRQDEPVTCISFRTDGQETMTTASESGELAVWDLNKRSLLGQVSNAHHGAITGIHYIYGEPVMISAGVDNALKTWISDMGDGMPRQLVLLEGHPKPVTAVKFIGNETVLTSGLDGSLRLFSLSRDTQRQKLGNAGIMSRAKAKKKRRDIANIELKPVIEMDVGLTREAAWDNVLCRHVDTALVTTWSTRKQALGVHRLLHKRFLTAPHLVSASASSICISSCGNFGIVGYTTGHIDCFNLQSGKHRKTFQYSKQDRRAHHSAVRGLAVDVISRHLISAEHDGFVRIWDFRSTKLLAELRVPSPIIYFRMSTSNSLLALGVANGSIGVLDVMCRKIVRIINHVHQSPFTVLEFSPDGKWLICADEDGLIKVWDLITNSLLDVMKCKFHCTSLCFSPSGEYMASCHHEQRSVYIWANKSMFSCSGGLKALPLDYLPETFSSLPVCRDMEDDSYSLVDDANENPMELSDEGVKDVKQVEGLLTLSGLAPPRWASLPYLDIIRERNKPTVPVQKPKTAPFFLPTVSTVDGFEFANSSIDGDGANRHILMAKRKALEIESSFAQTLLQVTDDADLVTAFECLKWMNISSIDFQIRILPEKAMSIFLKMLLTVLKNRHDFELVQSYLAAFLNIHRNNLWANDGNEDDLDKMLGELRNEMGEIWREIDEIMLQNASVIHWIKTALL